MEIRDARESDLPGLLAIYNDVIATSTAVYSYTPVSLEDRTQWWRARVGQGYPVLVALDESGVLGFSTFGDFRPWPGYRFTVEHSVHVRADYRGKGFGRQLIQVLFPRAAAMNVHMMIAHIDSAAAASLRLHEKLGFEQVGTFHEVGQMKSGQWLSVVAMQKRI